ncbi:TniQ family protein [Pseudomonas sp. ML96]|uniref:TniQ family protein n=1 Tax=Pseudomonas sp. ML96 TaxID=1523503 RepID=UPI0009DD2BE8|nr:TniQ family protein [Pseudomonas sp. ML96]
MYRLRRGVLSTFDPRNPLLAYRSRPREDESLLSWMTRLARGNAVKLQCLATDILGFSPQLLAHDLDRLPDEELLGRLVKRVGCTYEQAYSTGMWAYQGLLWFETPKARGPVDWLMPMGRSPHDRRRISSYTTQMCCACLASDPIPYFRRYWRLALAVVCPVHGIYLRDCCPWCHGPIEFHTTDFGCRLLPSVEPMMHCGKCGHDWCHESWDELSAPENLVWFQRQLCQLLVDGWSAELPGAGILSPAFFCGLKCLLQRLNQPGRCRRLREYFALRDAELLFDPCEHALQRFECLRLGDRARLMGMAQDLLMSWPNQFGDIARASRVSSSYFTDYRHLMPYWLHVAIRNELFDQDYAPSQQERSAAKDYLLRHGGTGSADEVNGLLGVASVNHRVAQRKRWNPRGPGARE